VPRRHKLLIAGVGGAVVLALVIAFVARGGQAQHPSAGQLATRATGLVRAGSNAEAVDLLERELVGPTKPDQAHAYLMLGHAQLSLARVQQALSAYERALRAVPSLGADKDLRANLLNVLDGKDSLASVLALELLASLTPPDHDAIVAYAANGKLIDARHRAVMIAERDGFGGKVDRVQSWAFDLQQASTCEERKAAIELLGRTADRRALAALKRVRSVKCIEREATDAIARIEAAAK
jgi:tetratricopeptide (TPR) repeat protein